MKLARLAGQGAGPLTSRLLARIWGLCPGPCPASLLQRLTGLNISGGNLTLVNRPVGHSGADEEQARECQDDALHGEPRIARCHS